MPPRHRDKLAISAVRVGEDDEPGYRLLFARLVKEAATRRCRPEQKLDPVDGWMVARQGGYGPSDCRITGQHGTSRRWIGIALRLGEWLSARGQNEQPRRQ